MGFPASRHAITSFVCPEKKLEIEVKKKKEKKKETKQTLCVELFGRNAFVKYSFQISFLVIPL